MNPLKFSIIQQPDKRWIWIAMRNNKVLCSSDVDFPSRAQCLRVLSNLINSIKLNDYVIINHRTTHGKRS